MLERFRQRKIVQWGLAYLAGAWLLLQFADVVGGQWGWPSSVQRAITVVLAVGLLPTLVIAWYHGERGRQKVGGLEILVLAVLMVTAGAIAFQVMRTDRSAGDIVTATVNAGRITHVTTAEGLELHPALSPDGRSVAFAAGLPGNMRIYLQSVAGGRAIPLAEGMSEHQRWPQWSPDGSRILFQTGRSAMDANQRYAIDVVQSAIYSVPSLGGTARVLVNEALGGVAPSWSPDGQRIAYVRNDTIVVASAEGSVTQRIASQYQTHSLRWSPDASRLAAVIGNSYATFGTSSIANKAPSSIVIVNLQNNNIHQVTDGDWSDNSPVWLPDGRSLLYVSDRAGGRDLYQIHLADAGRARGEPQRITTGINAHTIDLAHDGKTLTYAAYTSYTHIWSVPMPSGRVATLADATQLTFGSEVVEGLALSPDGKWIAYDSDRGGDPDVWKIPADGGEPSQITTRVGGDFVQDWSNDGKELSIHSFLTGHRDVFVISVDGSQTQQVVATPANESNPEFSPDGNSIAYQLYAGAPDIEAIQIVSRARPGAAWGTPRRLTAVAGRDPSWSPDGKWIAYHWNGALKVIEPSGANERLVFESKDPAILPQPEFAYWSADSRTLYYKAYDHERRSSIWSIPIEGGKPTLLVRFDDPTRPSLRREFASDGKRIYFTIAQHQSDVWVMELLKR